MTTVYMVLHDEGYFISQIYAAYTSKKSAQSFARRKSKTSGETTIKAFSGKKVVGEWIYVNGRLIKQPNS